MTKVTTRNYLNGECIEEIVQQFQGDDLVSETVTEFTPVLKNAHNPKSYTKQTPESIAKMLATRAAKKAKREEAK